MGSIFLRNDVLFDVAEIVVQADFFEPKNGEIFILLKDQIMAGRSATPMTILHDLSQDSDVGGLRASEHLSKLYEAGIPRDQAVEAARVIRDTAIRRRLISAAEAMTLEAFSAPVSTSADIIRDRFAETIDALFPTLADLGVVPISKYGDMALNRIVQAHRIGRPLGLEWGIAAMTNIIGTALPGRLYSLAGASGAGKSALAQQVLEFICRPMDNPDDQKYGLMVQAEMEGEEVAVRSLAAETGISGYDIDRGVVSDADFQLAFDANERLRGNGLMIDSGSSHSLRSIRAKAIRAKRKGRLHILAIDHVLYLEKENPKMNDVEAIMPNMRGLKAIAKDLQIPVLILMPLKSSYSDAISNGIVRRPNLGDVHHPAAVDVNSDAIMFVHRPEYILKRNEPPKADTKKHGEWDIQALEWQGRAEFIKAKQRGGDRGQWSQKLWFGDGSRAKFFDNEPSRYIPEQDGYLPLA